MEKNILLVDDDDKLRELISSYLEEKGFILSTCSDVGELEELINYFVSNKKSYAKYKMCC